MNAFDDADFSWEDSRRDRGSESKRRRSRSRERSPRSRRASRDRRRRSASRRRTSHRDAPSSAAALPVNLPSATADDVARRVRHFPTENFTPATSDWWCAVCSNPNPSTRVDCVRCGSWHTSDHHGTSSVKPSVELMSDFLPESHVEGIVEAVQRGDYRSLVQSLPLLTEYNLAMHTSTPADRSRLKRALLESIIAQVVAPVPECNKTLMYEVAVELAELEAPQQASMLPSPLSPDSSNMMQLGFVVCLRFHTVSQAKQCLTALSSRLQLPGIPLDERPLSLRGAVRLGFSLRRNIPKPSGRTTSSDAPILDVFEQQPAAVTPAAWEAPVFSDVGELKAYLTELFAQWDSLLPAQREYYEANIGRVMSTTAGKAAPKVTTGASGAPVSASVQSATSSIADMKKKLEERRLELERKRHQEQKTPVTAPEAPPQQAKEPAAGGLSVLEKLAQKKALLQQRLSAATGAPDSADHVSGKSATTAPDDPSLPASTPACCLMHLLVAAPPNFPTKTDYARNAKTINPRALLKFHGIPMDVAARILNPRFLGGDSANI